MRKPKVLYIINNAPNYRHKFLNELGNYCNLTVVSYSGADANLKDPVVRDKYKFIELTRFRLFGINLNFKEFTLACDEYDCIIVGFSLNSPFRLLNLLRSRKVIAAGLIYGTHDNLIIRLTRKFLLEKASCILVYSNIVKRRLDKEINNEIIAFNNTYFKRSEINPVPIPQLDDKLNILWVGRYQSRKKVERLYALAKCDERVNVRVVGPDNVKAFKQHSKLSNFAAYDEAYDDQLKRHFEWSHIVFNPGGVGLLVMNAARNGRAIVIDCNSYHGPEQQLALDSDQDFIDFSDIRKVQDIVTDIFNNPNILNKKASKLVSMMKSNYTLEHMTSQFLKGINDE